MRCLVLSLVLLVASSAGAELAGEPAPPKSQLEQQLDELDAVDQELAAIQQQLRSPTDAVLRRRLRARLRALRATQEQLLQAIEQVVGPLPPTARPDVRLPLEEQAKARQRHHEALLERDVQRRLPSN